MKGDKSAGQAAREREERIPTVVLSASDWKFLLSLLTEKHSQLEMSYKRLGIVAINPDVRGRVAAIKKSIEMQVHKQ